MYQWLKKEVLLALPSILFFAIVFNVMHYAETLMLRPGDHPYTSNFGATIGAIIAGKVILIANSFPYINAFPNKPLVWNISWKFIIYGLFSLVIQFSDMLLKGFLHMRNLAETWLHIQHEFSAGPFWGIQIQLMFMLLIFVIGHEVTRVIGKDRMKEIMLG